MNYTDTQLKQALAKMLPLLGCGVCGGKMVEIRGRHPEDKPRQVCPTCPAERIDDLLDIHARVESVSWQQRVESLAKVKGIKI